MVKLIVAPVGTGKTKLLSQVANEDIKKSRGHLVYIDSRGTYRLQVDYKIRFINIADYAVKGEESFYGFICGIIASNYDIETIYIDGLYRIMDIELDEMEKFFRKLEILDLKYNINFIITISSELEDIPEFLNKYLFLGQQ